MNKLDVLIVTRLTEGRFFDLVQSIRKHVSRDTLDDTVFYVCYTGDSDEDQARIGMSLEGLRYRLVVDKYNFARNNNMLAKMGEGECILCLNDDVEFESDAITHCLKLVQNPRIGTVGLKLLGPDGKVQHMGQMLIADRDTGRFKQITHYGIWLDGCQERAMCVDFPVLGNTGAFLMVSRRNYTLVEGFNEQYEHGFEDVEFNIRLALEGFLNVCCCEHLAVHRVSTTRKQALSGSDVARIVGFCNAALPRLVEERWKYGPTLMLHREGEWS